MTLESSYPAALLLKAPNWIGDAVMAEPAFRLLRSAFPNSRIDVLCRRGVSGVVRCMGLDVSIIEGDDRKLDRPIRERIRVARYDAAIVFTNTPRVALMLRWLGAGEVIGYGRGWQSPFLSKTVPFREERWKSTTPKPLTRKATPEGPQGAVHAEHTVRYYCELAAKAARMLGALDVTTSFYAPRLFVPEESEKKVQSLLDEVNLAGQNLIGIHAGAAYGEAKCWPAEKLAGAAVELQRETGWPIVSTGGPADSQRAVELERVAGVPIHRLGERLDIPGLAALLARLSIYIANDTGPMHMASALGTPTIAIFGPTDWHATKPMGARSVVVRHPVTCAPCFERACPIDHRCMLNIPTQDVVRAARVLVLNESQT